MELEKEKWHKEEFDTETALAEFMEAGLHFGHERKKRHPKAKKYLLCTQNGIDIIDLDVTVEKLKESMSFLESLTARGGKILFVGTKKNAKDIVSSYAEKLGQFYVTNKWMAGMLTNFRTIFGSLNKRKKIEKTVESNFLTNKEINLLKKKLEKLSTNLSGITDMKSLPDCLFVIDAKKEKLAIEEAKKLNIPVVAITDTDENIDNVDFGIPMNDDSIVGIELVMNYFSKSIVSGIQKYMKKCGFDLGNTENPEENFSNAYKKVEKQEQEKRNFNNMNNNRFRRPNQDRRN